MDSSTVVGDSWLRSCEDKPSNMVGVEILFLRLEQEEFEV